jgi:hypothetical protein
MLMFFDFRSRLSNQFHVDDVVAAVDAVRSVSSDDMPAFSGIPFVDIFRIRFALNHHSEGRRTWPSSVSCTQCIVGRS